MYMWKFESYSIHYSIWSGKLEARYWLDNHDYNLLAAPFDTIGLDGIGEPITL